MTATRYIGLKRQINSSGATNNGIPNGQAYPYSYRDWIDQTVDDVSADSAIAHFLDQVSEDITVDRGLIFPETSAQRVMRNRIPGQIAISGDIQVPLYTVGAPTLIYYALGSVTSAEATDPHVHTIKADFNAGPDAQGTYLPGPKIFQMAIGKDRKEHRFVGCVVKNFTFDYDPSETLLGTFNVMAREEIAAGDLAGKDDDGDSKVTFGEYNKADRAIGGTEIKVEINDVAEDSLESASVEVDNGFIDDNYALGNRYVPQAYVQNHVVNGSLEFGYDNYSRYENVVQEAKWKLELLGAQTGKTGANVRKIEVELPQIALKTVNLPTEGTDRYILSVDYEGERTTNPDLIIVKVTNVETNANMVL